MYFSRIIAVLFGCLLAKLPFTESSSCIFGDYDFSLLKSSEWDVRWRDGSANYTYLINVCDNIKNDQCGDQSSVCRITKGGPTDNIGTFAESLNITEERGEMWLHLTGGPCSSKPQESSRAIINFKCGRSLGSPMLVEVNACETFFEWSTHLACKRTFTGKEVKCYVYDNDGDKRDLSPLIKKSGNYTVESQNQRRFYINVCRELQSGTGCANGISACMMYDGHVEDYGTPISGLHLNGDNELQLTYTTETKPSECESNPETTITFKCPKRGLAHGPLLISDLQCHYQVEWLTEYACPERTLVAVNSCNLTMEEHQVEIDLRPLKRSRTDHQIMWNTTGKDGSDVYRYHLNVCNFDEDDGIPCPDADDKASVCQKKDSDTGFGKITGIMKKQKLRYSDRNLTMIYEGGEKCSDNFHRTTVINFHCSESAGGLNGEGWPYFNSEEGCTYIFDWETKYACLDHPLSATCSVQSGMKNFDLTPLVRESGGNWEAQSGHDTSNERYFINLCHGVVKSEMTKECPVDAAACRVTDGRAYSMGKYTENPTYQSDGSIRLHYTDGHRGSETIITFKCKPGDLESAPALVRVASDSSAYEFEWHTAAACVEATTNGSNCNVFDDQLGLDFDLKQLTKPNSYYSVPVNEYVYYINVCDKIKGAPCDDNAGVCQGKPTEPTFHKNGGRPNSLLSYYDGMINLTYSNGDAYSNGKLRKSQITFLCDRDAGHGHPEYVEERENTYFFKWMTVLACPEAKVECLVYDHHENRQYDLSSLSKGKDEGNWNALNDHNGPRQKFYINLCRTLNPIDFVRGSCDPDAAVCMTEFENNEEVVKKANLGALHGNPIIEDNGILVHYTYTSNEQTCSTKIHLKCQPGALSTSPTYISTLENCEYVFEWNTEAACPLNSKLPTLPPHTDNTPALDKCQLEDPTSEYVFNLMPLMKKKSEPYTVQADGKTFKLNICGAVESCTYNNGEAAAICESTTALGRVETALSFSDGGFLTLKYSGTSSNGETILTFKCDRKMTDDDIAKVTFVRKDVREDVSSYLFDVNTPLACPPIAVDCVVTDSAGKEYDLSPLAKHTDNWNVIETTDGRTDLQYFINVCRPINVGTGREKDCPGGTIGGCQVVTNGPSFSMGYVQSQPIARNDGSLSIRYLGGTKCHVGKDNESHRSTRINFFCSTVQEDPVFQGETPECEYVFEWRTPSACPQTKTVGENCRVTEPLYNYQFNLATLKKQASDYSVKVTSGGDEYTYLLNVCGPLNFKGCGDDAGSCQTKPSDNTFQPVNAGNSNSAITYEDGLLSLTYTGGRGNCHGKHERKTIINFRCDYSTYGSLGPTFVKEDSECVYIFDWATHWACTPFKVADCGITDPQTGKQYELSSLTLPGDNYAIQSQNSENTKLYLINVCTTLVHKNGQTCPMNAAACSKTKDNKYEAIGNLPLQNEPRLLSFDELRNVIVTYNHGKDCIQDGKKTGEWKTQIIFNCDKKAIDAQPQFLYEDETVCKTLFTWETAAACPINDQADVEDDCTVKNSLTGYEFDIKALKSETKYVVDDNRGHKFDINICASVKESFCDEPTGSCQYESATNKWNAGNFNRKLYYEEGLIWANYTGGKKCHGDKYERNTVINFVCAKEGTGNGHPVFVDETDDCTYYFSWHTELACEKKVECTVSANGRVYDLSPLIKADGHHLAVTTSEDSSKTDDTYYINICRPLNPIDSTLCPPLSSACKVTPKGEPVSLGRLGGRPTYDSSTGKVVLVYDHGAECTANQMRNITSKIIFTCEKGPSQGAPVLEEITDDCEYIFSWATNVICDEGIPQQSGTCQYTDPRTQYTFDLSPLHKSSGAYEVISPSEQMKYYVNPCGAISTTNEISTDCNNAAVCQVNNNAQGTVFGNADKEFFIMEGNNLKVGYTDGESCSSSASGKSAAYILFECANDVTDNGQPEFFSRGPCDVVFKWRTPLACPPVSTDCAFGYAGKTYDLHVLSRSSGSWSFKDGSGNEYWLNLCQSIHNSPDGMKCPRNAAVCWKKNNEVQMLGTVTSQSMTFESDKLIVKYSDGDNGACAVRKRRSNNPAADVNIYFSCGNSIGKPEVLPKKGDSCSFDIQWISSVACEVRKQLVFEEKGLITDPESLGTIDLNELDRDYEVKSGSNIYKINLKGQINGADSNCKNAVVCQTSPAQNVQTLADISTVKYFVADDILEATYESKTTCNKDSSKNVNTIITFHCAKSEANPTLTYMSAHCHYLFDWYTPVACVTPDTLGPVAVPVGENDATSSASHAHTAGIFVGVLVSIIVLIVLLVILLNKDRRTWCAYRARSLFRKTMPLKRMSYSQLSSSADSENYLLGRGETASLPSFHDDSDEDLIL